MKLKPTVTFRQVADTKKKKHCFIDYRYPMAPGRDDRILRVVMDYAHKTAARFLLTDAVLLSSSIITTFCKIIIEMKEFVTLIIGRLKFSLI